MDTQLKMMIDDYDNLSFINSEDLEEWMSETKRAYEFLPSQYYPKLNYSFLHLKDGESGSVGEFNSQTNIFTPLWRAKGKRVANGTPAIERAMAKAQRNDSEFRDAFNAEEPVSLGMAYDKIKEAMGIIGSLISSQASVPQKVDEMLCSACHEKPDGEKQ